MDHKVNQIGPFESENQARTSPAARRVYEAFDRDPGAGKMHPHNLAVLTDAIAAAEVTLGEFDRRIVSWLAGWETTTAVVVAGIIRRAADGPDELPADDESADLTTVLAALDIAAEELRDRVARCPDCDADPADLCGTCESRLARADDFDALAARFAGTGGIPAGRQRILASCASCSVVTGGEWDDEGSPLCGSCGRPMAVEPLGPPGSGPISQAQGRDVPAEYELTLRALFIDAIAYCKSRHPNTGAASQAGLYRALARQMGLGEFS